MHTIFIDIFKRSIRLIVGLFFAAIGNVLMLHADLGLNPWGVLHQGISLNTPLTFGQANQIIGLLIVIFCIFFKIIPGLGTILNMFFLGAFIDILNQTKLFITPKYFIIKLLILLLGVVFISLGTCLYMRESLGAGPRDGLMVVFSKKMKVKAGYVRIFIELFALILGYILGGKVGIGTLVFALILGFTLNKVFYIFQYDPREKHHENIAETINKIKNITNSV